MFCFDSFPKGLPSDTCRLCNTWFSSDRRMVCCQLMIIVLLVGNGCHCTVKIIYNYLQYILILCKYLLSQRNIIISMDNQVLKVRMKNLSVQFFFSRESRFKSKTIVCGDYLKPRLRCKSLSLQVSVLHRQITSKHRQNLYTVYQ